MGTDRTFSLLGVVTKLTTSAIEQAMSHAVEWGVLSGARPKSGALLEISL